MSVFDTNYAETLTKVMATTLSTFAIEPDSLLNYLRYESVPYGVRSYNRPLADPDDEVNVSTEWQAIEAEAKKISQKLDLACIHKRIGITEVEYAGDPANYAIHLRDLGEIFRKGLEKAFIVGTSNPLTYGLLDNPSGTAGTVTRPEQIARVATSGNWTTAANIRTDIINGVQGLVSKKFYGRQGYLMVAPPIVKPMLSDLVTTGVLASSEDWIKSIGGLTICYSEAVDANATKDAFDVAIIDRAKCAIGLSDMHTKALHDEVNHKYLNDWEIYASPLFDPLHDGTEYLKSVYLIGAVDWDA